MIDSVTKTVNFSLSSEGRSEMKSILSILVLGEESLTPLKRPHPKLEPLETTVMVAGNGKEHNLYFSTFEKHASEKTTPSKNFPLIKGQRTDKAKENTIQLDVHIKLLIHKPDVRSIEINQNAKSQKLFNNPLLQNSV